MEYFESIKFYRKQKGLTQQQLAEEVKVSRQTVTRWENGWNVPSLFYAEKLAKCFGITVTELMNGEKAEGQTEKQTLSPQKRDLLHSTVWICVLSFLPVALSAIFDAFEETLRRYLLLLGYTSAVDYREVTDRFAAACGACCAVVLILLAAWWISRLIGEMREADDKYFRYVIYRQWNIGLIFIITNAVEFAFVQYSYIELYYLDYISAVFIALCIDLVFDIIFKKKAQNLMIIEKNAQLDKIKLVYLIIESVWLVALGIFTVYAFMSYGGSAVMGVAVIFMIFTFIAFLIELSYVIVRLSVKH